MPSNLSLRSKPPPPRLLHCPEPPLRSSSPNFSAFPSPPLQPPPPPSIRHTPSRDRMTSSSSPSSSPGLLSPDDVTMLPATPPPASFVGGAWLSERPRSPPQLPTSPPPPLPLSLLCKGLPRLPRERSRFRVDMGGALAAAAGAPSREWLANMDRDASASAAS